MNYEEPQKASVKQHKLELAKQLRYDMETLTPEEIAERGHIIEEYGRILEELYDMEDDKIITIYYFESMNVFEILNEKGE